MQSGITASAELHNAFAQFTSDASSFALPVTIDSEALQPLDPVLWPNSTDFHSALPHLAPHLHHSKPVFLLLRKTAEPSTSDLTAVTYIPSTAPVRSKTLFASTRATLVRELGSEKFSETLFVTEAAEILEPSQWIEREKAQSRDMIDPSLLSYKERELQSVKRAEEEERHGTSGRDLMGEGGSGGSREGTGAARSGIRMNITDEVKEAIAELARNVDESKPGVLVQVGIDIATETLTLLASVKDISPADVSGHIPGGRPSYTFYHFPSTASTVFIYVCPASSKVKERMLYASSRNGVLEIAQDGGVVVSKKLEAGDPDEIAEPRLTDEVGVHAAGTETLPSRQGFARPKRPGRR